MEKIMFAMSKDACDACSLALRRFIGNLDGVESISVDDGRVVIDFDESKISREELSRITNDSIEKLGYQVKY